MKLTPFGEAVRLLRVRYGLSLKSMAEEMGISSSYLSSIEFGDKRLVPKHIESAVKYLGKIVTSEQLADVKLAAEKSKITIHTGSLPADARGLVSAFARRLQEGAEPTNEIMKWLESRPKDTNE